MHDSSRFKFPLLALIGSLGIGATCGSFEERVVDASAPTDPWMKGIGDLDGDGRQDLVIAGRSGPLVWYESPGWTRRTISTATGSPGTSTGLAIGDVDRNGSPDIVLANGVWFANPRPGAPAESGTWARHQIDATTGHDVQLSDLDRDGDLDVVKRNQGSTGDVIRVFRQNAGGSWTERAIPAPAGEGLAVGDLDADGDADIAIGGRWYENDGNPISGAWNGYSYSSTYTHPHVVVKIGNIGGSSRADIVLSPAEYAGGSYRLSWFEAPANAKTTWPERIVETGVENVVHALTLADFDRNGRTDLAVAEMHQGANPDRVRVLLQGSGGGFTSILISSLGSHSVVAGDLDGNGRSDLFGANHSTAQSQDGARAKIWLNRL